VGDCSTPSPRRPVAPSPRRPVAPAPPGSSRDRDASAAVGQAGQVLSCLQRPLIGAVLPRYKRGRPVWRATPTSNTGWVLGKRRSRCQTTGSPPKTTHMGLGGRMRDRYRDLCLGRHRKPFAWTCRSSHHLREITDAIPRKPQHLLYWHLLPIGNAIAFLFFHATVQRTRLRKMARAALEGISAPIFTTRRSKWSAACHGGHRPRSDQSVPSPVPARPAPSFSHDRTHRVRGGSASPG
jgi:hypothetical protein